MHHCYHSGQHVYSVDMPVSEALRLARGSLESAENELEEWQDEVAKYEKLNQYKLSES